MNEAIEILIKKNFELNPNRNKEKKIQKNTFYKLNGENQIEIENKKILVQPTNETIPKNNQTKSNLVSNNDNKSVEISKNKNNNNSISWSIDCSKYSNNSDLTYSSAQDSQYGNEINFSTNINNNNNNKNNFVTYTYDIDNNNDSQIFENEDLHPMSYVKPHELEKPDVFKKKNDSDEEGNDSDKENNDDNINHSLIQSEEKKTLTNISNQKKEKKIKKQDLLKMILQLNEVFIYFFFIILHHLFLHLFSRINKLF